MASVLHRTKGSSVPYEHDYRTDVDLSDYPIEDWIHNPVVPTTHGDKYWKVVGDDVTIISDAEFDVRWKERWDYKHQQKVDKIKNHTTADVRLMAIVSLMMDEINILRSRDGLSERTFQDYKDQIKQRIDSLS